MRITASIHFRDFLDANNNKYPYNEMRKTRNSYVCKWVLLKSSTRQAAQVQSVQTEYKAVLTSSFPSCILEEFLVRESALPLTPHLNPIMDDMEVWGRSRSYDWYCDVLNLLAHTIRRGVSVQGKKIMRYCIEYEVKALIYSRLPFYSPAAKLILLEWRQYYDVTFTTSSKLNELTVASVQFVLYRMAQSTVHVALTYMPENTVSSDSDTANSHRRF